MRKLSELETKFLAEAEAGHFRAARDDTGAPFALGAVRTSNLFSMEVIESPDVYSGGSLYTLPSDTD